MSRNLDKYLLLLPFVIWASLPILSYSTLMRLLTFLGLGGFMAISILEISIFKKKKLNILAIIVSIVIIYIFATNILFAAKQYQLNRVHLSVFLTFVPISVKMIKDKPPSARLFMLIILITNLITIILTIYGLSTSHYIARILSKSNEEAEVLAKSGVAGYSLVYSNVVLIPLLFISLKNNFSLKLKKIPLTILILLNLVGAYILFVKALYTIALISSFVVLLFIIISNTRKRYIGLMFIGVFTFLIIANPSVDIPKFIESTEYAKKFIDVIEFVSSNKSTGTVESRSGAYFKSLNTIFEYPLTGFIKFDLGGKIGGHSDIMDPIAQWGIFFGFIIIFTIFYYPLKLWKILRSKYKREVLALFFAIGAVAGLNTIPLHFSLAFLYFSSYCVLNPQVLKVQN